MTSRNDFYAACCCLSQDSIQVWIRNTETSEKCCHRISTKGYTSIDGVSNLVNSWTEISYNFGSGNRTTLAITF